jgi:hypothetical protein
VKGKKATVFASFTEEPKQVYSGLRRDIDLSIPIPAADAILA